jgi:hypothetical protein
MATPWIIMSIFDDIANRRLRIECSEITLVRKGAPSLSVKGSGETTVDQAGQLQFRFAVPKEQYQPYVTARLAKPRPVPDDPKDEDYFELTAIAFSGEIFRGRLLHPEVSNIVPEGFWNGPGIAEGIDLTAQPPRSPYQKMERPIRDAAHDR